MIRRKVNSESSTQPQRTCPPSFGKIVAFGLCLAPLAPALAAAQPNPFETQLRRSILIKGQERGTYTLAERMNHYRVPGISVAVVDACRIVDARGFGTSPGSNTLVGSYTLFQAGSISKVVTAVAALRLVEDGKLSLDGDIRRLLKDWTLTTAEGIPPAPVTLRQLLAHTAGINQISGKGYRKGDPLPTLTKILDGSAPANTPAIRVQSTPGKWAYSSGGYYIVQALMAEAANEQFPLTIQRLVFQPAGMIESTFSQPLDSGLHHLAASGVGPDGTPLQGGWLVNPELAGGGLWSTPSDLARFAIALATNVRGDSHPLLSASSAREMMTRGPGNWGLGVGLGSPEGPRRFGHTGHNTGFVSEFVMYPDTCQGAVVMTNADQGGWLVTEVLRAIGEAYHWPDQKPLPVQEAIPLTDAVARRFIGTYRLRDFPEETFIISQTPAGNLYWARTGHIGRDLLPESADKLFSPDSRMTLEVDASQKGPAYSLQLSFGGGKNIADRAQETAR